MFKNYFPPLASSHFSQEFYFKLVYLSSEKTSTVSGQTDDDYFYEVCQLTQLPNSSSTFDTISSNFLIFESIFENLQCQDVDCISVTLAKYIYTLLIPNASLSFFPKFNFSRPILARCFNENSNAIYMFVCVYIHTPILQ